MFNKLKLLLVIALTPILANAITPTGESVNGTIMLQGGSDSSVKWFSPSTSTYKIHVLVPKTGTLNNVLYRVYPKGKKANSTTCISTDVKYPCFEVTINQTQYPNMWVQLMLNDDITTQWDFNKDKGYVTAVANNLGAVDLLNLTAIVRFEDTALKIGKNYQGGIIFYLDNTGQHGLIASPKDILDSNGNPAYIPWYNGSLITTGATGTAIGTGKMNTAAIIAAQGTGNYAAKLADDLVVGKYSDWYLPSKNELNLMYQNIGQGASAPLTNIGKFADDTYWSSSEMGDVYASFQYFNGGFNGNNMGKDGTILVRAIRSF